ncbi:MAG: HD domain-containing protein, partial [Endomicrobia bacterium]|nr:HD domain-containing protein [Endomicrobiia bacterium]
AKKYYYHPHGLFQHSFETLEAVEDILNNLKKYFPDNYKELEAHFADSENYSENVVKGNLLKFAALFHDNAKPETAKKEGKKMRFFGHEEQGAKKIEEIAQSFKMSKKDTANAKFLVENHMRPSTLTKNNIVTKRAALKFFRDIGENTPDLIILSMADWHSYKKLKVFSPKELKMQENSARVLISQYYEVKNAKPLPKLVDGNILMKKFDLKPGPWLGDLLRFVKEAQQEGKISDKKTALKLISSKIKQIKKKYKLEI